MEIVIKGEAKEIADLITELCDRQLNEPATIAEAMAEKLRDYLEKCSNSKRASFSE